MPNVAAINSALERDPAEKYVLHGPEKNETLDNKFQMPVGKLLLEQMRKHGERIAQVNADDDSKESFASLRLRSILVAQELRSRGICEGDMVTVCARNTADTFAAVLGALFVPVAVSNIAVELDTDEIKILLNIANPKIIFCATESSQKMEQAVREINLETEIIIFGEGRMPRLSFSSFQVVRGSECYFEPAKMQDLDSTSIVLFSSGSTGSPKGVAISNKIAPRIIETPTTGDGSIVFVAAPLCWYTGILILLQYTYNGNTRVYTAQPFSEKATLSLIQKYKVDLIMQGTSLVHRIAKYPSIRNFDLSSLKVVVVGGSKMCYKLAYTLCDVLPNAKIVCGYGSTELGFFSANIVGQGKDNSVGKLITGCSLKIVEITTGTILGPNKEGEIYAKSWTMASGYYHNQEATRKVFDKDGWFQTGDMGYYDEDSFLFITDRLKETLKYRGFQILPADVEPIVLKHPDVVECGIVGVPDVIDGDRLLAFVQKVPGSNVTEQEIKDFVAGQAPVKKHLHGGVIFMDSIPLLPSGKMDKARLKKIGRDMTKLVQTDD